MARHTSESNSQNFVYCEQRHRSVLVFCFPFSFVVYPLTRSNWNETIVQFFINAHLFVRLKPELQQPLTAGNWKKRRQKRTSRNSSNILNMQVMLENGNCRKPININHKNCNRIIFLRRMLFHYGEWQQCSSLKLLCEDFSKNNFRNQRHFEGRSHAIRH